MEKHYKQLDKLSIYMHYWITNRVLQEIAVTYPIMSFEDFCNKPHDPWTGETKLNEWEWKFPHINLKLKSNNNYGTRNSQASRPYS